MNTDNFKTKLKRCGVKQEYLAYELNVTQGLISQWCTGKCNPNIFQIQKIAGLLKITTDEAIDLFKTQANSLREKEQCA